MAWANGNKKWTVPFVSLNGTSCRVDIYARDYAGDTVTELSLSNTNAPGCAAANPFEYSEDNDSDLLNVIRYRTGYLRLIEHEYGGLADIYPSVNTDRYVEFYYGETLDFVGYIMAQDFDNDWVAGPRQIDLPIISPLGLANGTRFDYTSYNPPRWMSIQDIIIDCLNKLDGGYTGFYFPQYIPSSSSLDLVMTGFYINSLTFCPWGDANDKEAASLEGIYDAKSVEEALTMICTSYGLILHDAAATPCFQRLDWNGDYCLKGLDTSRAKYEPSVTDLTAIAEIDSKDNKESRILPLSKIEVTYDGEIDVPGMTFNRCRGYLRGSAIADTELCSNIPKIADFDGTIESAVSIDSNGDLPAGKIALGAFGQGSLSEMIMFQPDSNWTDGYKICSYKFFEWNGESGRLRFNHKYGDSIENLNNPQYISPLVTSYYAVIAVRIVSGNYYFSTQSGWQTMDNTLIYTKSWINGEADCEVAFLPLYVGTPQPLEIEFYAASGNRSAWIRTISNVSLINYESAANAYLKSKDKNKRTIEGSPSNETGSVTQGCSLLIYNSNRIRYNSSTVSGNAWVDVVNNEPTYPYLLQAQDRLELDMTMTPQTPATLYLNRFSLWNSTNKWRVIARSFEAWNDKHTITLHHSPIFDY